MLVFYFTVHMYTYLRSRCQYEPKCHNVRTIHCTAVTLLGVLVRVTAVLVCWPLASYIQQLGSMPSPRGDRAHDLS